MAHCCPQNLSRNHNPFHSKHSTCLDVQKSICLMAALYHGLLIQERPGGLMDNTEVFDFLLLIEFGNKTEKARDRSGL